MVPVCRPKRWRICHLNPLRKCMARVVMGPLISQGTKQRGPIKSPRLPGVTMFLYWLLMPLMLAAEFHSRDNFRTSFRISFIFGRIDGPELEITWLDFGQFLLWPWPWIFKVKYGICYVWAKNGPIAMKRKQTYRLKSRPQIWLWIDLVHDLEHELSRSNMKFAISEPMVGFPWSEKQTYWLKSRPQM